jgi:hypothetical protein
VPSLVAKPTGKKSEAERLASLYSHIQEKARIELSPNALLVPGAERGLMTAIGFGLPKGTEISIAPPAPGTAEIQGSTAGLVVSMPIKTELLVTNL